jgi:hypothetical protein
MQNSTDGFSVKPLSCKIHGQLYFDIGNGRFLTQKYVVERALSDCILGA